jgi:hypothetical protein
MRTIYKYQLKVTDEQDLLMPKDAEILCIKEVNGEVCIYAYVDNQAIKESRRFLIYGTGHEIENDMWSKRKYIGTFVKQNGFVGHLFEDLKL